MDDDGAFSGVDSDSSSVYSDDDGIVVHPQVLHIDEAEHSDYKILDVEMVIQHMNKIIEEVAEIVDLPTTVCRLLLHHYKWNKESLLERFYEATDSNAFFADANIVSPFQVFSRTSDHKTDKFGTCEICYSNTLLTGLLCSHKFCFSCWDAYLTTKIMEEGRPHVACP